MELFRDEQEYKRRRTGTVEEEEEGRLSSSSSIESLPPDIVYFILSRLPITSLVQFSCVSRAWRSLARDPNLAASHFSVTSRSHEDPLLIFHGICPIQNRLSFLADHVNSSNGKIKKLRLPFLLKMPEFDVVGSCNGLLCLSDSLYEDILFVYNPFTNLCKQLPVPLQYSAQEVALGFGYSDVTKQYKVVRVVYYRKTAAVPGATRISYSQSQIQILCVGSDAWRDLGRASFHIDCSSSSSTLINGRLHWMTRRRWDRGVRTRTIVSFDFEDERFREVPKPDCGGLNRWNFHLLVLEGRLAAAVFESSGELEIWALMAGDGGWRKEYDIGAYLPKKLKGDVGRRRVVMGPKKVMEGRLGRVVWVLKNGNILIEYRNRVLVCYDPQRRKFQDLSFQGLPSHFRTIVHTGSLNQIHTPIYTSKLDL